MPPRASRVRTERSNVATPLERQAREDGVAVRAVCAMNRDSGDELHAQVAGQMLGLSLVDLLDADHVGVHLPHDVGNAPEADSPVEASTPVDVVRRHPEHVAGGTACGGVGGCRSGHQESPSPE